MSDIVLFYGGTLDALRRQVKDEFVDMVYLDPPSGRNQDYPSAPGLYAEPDGTRAAEQLAGQFVTKPEFFHFHVRFLGPIAIMSMDDCDSGHECSLLVTPAP